nr:MAG TPA: hypothetical protein [Caudoviricetes sp.]
MMVNMRTNPISVDVPRDVKELGNYTFEGEYKINPEDVIKNYQQAMENIIADGKSLDVVSKLYEHQSDMYKYFHSYGFKLDELSFSVIYQILHKTITKVVIKAMRATCSKTFNVCRPERAIIRILNQILLVRVTLEPDYKDDLIIPLRRMIDKLLHIDLRFRIRNIPAKGLVLYAGYIPDDYKDVVREAVTFKYPIEIIELTPKDKTRANKANIKEHTVEFVNLLNDMIRSRNSNLMPMLAKSDTSRYSFQVAVLNQIVTYLNSGVSNTSNELIRKSYIDNTYSKYSYSGKADVTANLIFTVWLNTLYENQDRTPTSKKAYNEILNVLLDILQDIKISVLTNGDKLLSTIGIYYKNYSKVININTRTGHVLRLDTKL